MGNDDIRLKARGAGVPLWQIAKYLGISESTMTRMLRAKVDRDTKRKILEAIQAIKEEQDEQ